MRILHYSLGFPPYRTGGLTKFSVDLMKQQVLSGNKVGLLWPGEIKIINRETKIKKRDKFGGIESYEIINPAPVPYDEGIIDIDKFIDAGDIEIYDLFFDKWKPEIIHIHTFMGMQNSFIVAAKKKNIKLVYTTHDFFPICPKVTMFKNGDVCDDASSCEFCESCNSTALPLWKIFVLQTPVYRILKDNYLVKKMRKNHRNNYLGQTNVEVKSSSINACNKYVKLRNYYIAMLSQMDLIHYNSELAYHVYKNYIDNGKYRIINISHGDIADHRILKDFANRDESGNWLNITYLGPLSAAKGFIFLKNVLDSLWVKKQNFILNVYFNYNGNIPYIRCHERYSYNELKNIFDNTDVLIVPSLWNETFGYTALEALSYGVPVIVSDHVGAKDIIPIGAGVIYEHGNEKELLHILEELTINQLKEMNNVIVKKANIVTMESFNEQLINECY